MRSSLRLFALFLPLLTARVTLGAEPQVGSFSLTFTEKSASSDVVKITKRAGWALETLRKTIDVDYDLSAESFEAYVPADYKGDAAFGLIVWVNAGPKGGVPPQWKEVLDRRKLIWVGANNSGNPRSYLIRMCLAFDAVVGVRSRYKIDPQRTYIAGTSGGGKIASVLGIEYPEIFPGGFYMLGADFYRNVPTGEPNHYWFKAFNVPPGKLLADVKLRSRHVLLTGEKDINREPLKAFAEAFKADRFEHVTLLDVPGLGHQLPDAEWFEKGIVALDEIPPPTTKPASRPKIVRP